MNLENIDFIESGCNHVFCKAFNNDLFVWGDNEYGQLGIGNNIHQYLPYKCTNWTSDIVEIKCGINFTLILTNTQEVYSCGGNVNGQLGLGDIESSTFFARIPSLSEIVRIECGQSHAVCLDIYNNLFVFGSNMYGQLGIGEVIGNIKEPIKHPSLSNIIDISNGGCHTFVKTSNNEIFAFGYNDKSQLGIETENEKQYSPIQVLQGNEQVWDLSFIKSKAKSARSMVYRN